MKFWSFINLPYIILIIYKPTQNLGTICLAVLTFIGHKQTNKQTDKQIIYIYIDETKTKTWKTIRNEDTLTLEKHYQWRGSFAPVSLLQRRPTGSVSWRLSSWWTYTASRCRGSWPGPGGTPPDHQYSPAAGEGSAQY